MLIQSLLIAVAAASSFNSTVHQVDAVALPDLDEKPAVVAVAEAPIKRQLPMVAKAKKVWITAYSSTPDQTDDTPFTTASGSHVRDGIIATNMLPFGTKVQIPALFGDKVFIVEDRMHRRKIDMVDIWFPTRTEALRFGSNYAEIVVLDQPTELTLLK